MQTIFLDNCKEITKKEISIGQEIMKSLQLFVQFSGVIY